MKELALNILDIAKNSVKAGAAHIGISIVEEGALRTLTIRDDGSGIPEEMLRTVMDPFTTTRTTRRVGMGLPLLKDAAEQTGGRVEILSQQGEAHGTVVTATFFTDNIDCVPMGDLATTMVTLIQGSPDVDFVLSYRTAAGEKSLDTAVMREILGQEVPLNTPAVLLWIRDQIDAPFTPGEE